jgi:hypothetical protein
MCVSVTVSHKKIYTQKFIKSIEGTGADRRDTVIVSLCYKALGIFIGSRDRINKTTCSRSGYNIYHWKSNSAEECKVAAH